GFGLSAMIRFDTFTAAIVDQFQSVFNGPAANVMAGVLVLCCLALLSLEYGARGDERYARIGSGAARTPVHQRPGRWTVPCLLIHAGMAVLALGVPLVTITRWLVAGGADIWRVSPIGAALGQTLMLALVGAVIATLAAAPLAWLSVRSPSRMQRILEA